MNETGTMSLGPGASIQDLKAQDLKIQTPQALQDPQERYVAAHKNYTDYINNVLNKLDVGSKEYYEAMNVFDELLKELTMAATAVRKDQQNIQTEVLDPSKPLTKNAVPNADISAMLQNAPWTDEGLAAANQKLQDALRAGNSSSSRNLLEEGMNNIMNNRYNWR